MADWTENLSKEDQDNLAAIQKANTEMADREAARKDRGDVPIAVVPSPHSVTLQGRHTVVDPELIYQ
jgi:hypothetical protein